MIKDTLQHQLRELTTLSPYRHIHHNLLNEFRLLIENSPVDSNVALFCNGGWGL